MTAKPEKEPRVALMVRLPKALHAQLSLHAATREIPVALNSEIVFRLTQSFK